MVNTGDTLRENATLDDNTTNSHTDIILNMYRALGTENAKSFSKS